MGPFKQVNEPAHSGEEKRTLPIDLRECGIVCSAESFRLVDSSLVLAPKLGLRGFFNMRFFRHATIFHGCAVGGGSITYAGTLLSPPDKVWEAGSWAGLANWKAEMAEYYQTASCMLGVTQNKILGPADRLLKRTGEAAGSGQTFYHTSVGIFEANEGRSGNQTFPDLFFGRAGRPRTTCTSCGAA